MKREPRFDRETFRVFLVLGLLTAFALLAVHWALNAPLSVPLAPNSRPTTEIPASK